MSIMGVMKRAGALSVLLVCAAGCGRTDEVAHYRAPKDPAWRMLAAIARGKDATWFFKVVAAPPIVESARGEVLAFLRTLRTENGQIRWSAPAGWHEVKGPPERLATYRIGDREPCPELSVSRLPGDGGGLAGNVSRWRDQIGLEAASAREIESQAEKLAGSDLDVRVVDLTGPTRPGMGMGSRPPARPPEEPAAGSDRGGGVSYDTPAGWIENPTPPEGRIMEFKVNDPAGSATASLTAMSGDGGGLQANIDRWRQQAGLEPLGEQAVARSATPIRFVRTDAWLVEAMGGSRAILGVIAQTPAGTLFLKLDGPPAVVAAQREALVRFAGSFKLGGAHE